MTNNGFKSVIWKLKKKKKAQSDAYMLSNIILPNLLGPQTYLHGNFIQDFENWYQSFEMPKLEQLQQ